MKQFSFLIFVLLCAKFAVAQQYTPFPVSGVQWTVYYWGGCIQDTPPDTMLFTYQLYGDTSINSKTYTQLGVTGNGSGTPLMIGGIREENKKVYYITTENTHPLGTLADGGTEILLYDFNALPGDLIVHDSSLAGSSSYTPEVQAIDSVWIGGTYRKRYQMGSAQYARGTEYWVEGIGSMTDGLLSKITRIPTCGSRYWENICFSENGTRLYLNPGYTDCNASRPLTSIVATATGAAIKIFPNPATEGSIYINDIAPGDGIQLKVIDYTGRVLQTAALQQRNNKIKLPERVPFCILILTDKQGRSIRVQKITAD